MCCVSAKPEIHNFIVADSAGESVDTPRYFRNVFASTATCLLCIPAALAADAGSSADLGEVVVTGQKQAYRGDTPLQELPQSVEVLTAGLLKDVGVTRLDDACA